jgi:uncharacterized protein with von Willebrand factor type A (vWA) domain
MNHLPLLELFTRLREAGLQLGVDDYQTALEALQAGFGIGDRADLASLCRTLWVKSEEERRLFDYHFDRSIASEMSFPKHSASILSPIPVQESLPSDDVLIESLDLRHILSTVSIYALSVVFVVVPFVLSALMGRTNHYPIFISQPVKEAVRDKLYKYDIKTKDIDAGDKLTIQAWISIDGRKYPITKEGIRLGVSLQDQPWDKKQKTLDFPSWLRFKDNGDGTAILDSTDERPKSTEKKDQSESQYQIELKVSDQQKGSSRQSFNLRESDKSSTGKPFHVLFILLIWVAVPIVLYLIYLRSKTSKSRSNSKSFSTANLPASSEKKSSTERFTETIDEDKVNASTSPFSPKFPTIIRRSFRQTNEYSPLTRRQMKQSWRFLRRMVRTGIPVELDIEATLNQIGRQGTLLEPVLIPRRVNRSKLLLLIDQDGSMVPFHGFSARLVETAMRGGQLDDINIYYFHNCPLNYLYGDQYSQRAELIDEVMSNNLSYYTSVLIFSDAGAARGTLNTERVELTNAFLTVLKRRIRYVAWLNPVPSSRWQGTTANQISRFIPMFELNKRGLDNTISVLRGRFK